MPVALKSLRVIYSLLIASLISAVICLPVQAATLSWKTLTPAQQEALAPIAQEWDKLPQKQQKRLLATSVRYPKLSPDQKQRFQTRLTEWVKLSPEQRNKVREKHKVFSKLPPEKREEVKRKIRQQEEAKNAASSASGVAATGK